MAIDESDLGGGFDAFAFIWWLALHQDLSFGWWSSFMKLDDNDSFQDATRMLWTSLQIHPGLDWEWMTKQDIPKSYENIANFPRSCENSISFPKCYKNIENFQRFCENIANIITGSSWLVVGALIFHQKGLPYKVGRSEVVHCFCCFWCFYCFYCLLLYCIIITAFTAFTAFAVLLLLQFLLHLPHSAFTALLLWLITDYMIIFT